MNEWLLNAYYITGVSSLHQEIIIYNNNFYLCLKLQKMYQN